jgi:hypothetical protein
VISAEDGNGAANSGGHSLRHGVAKDRLNRRQEAMAGRNRPITQRFSSFAGNINRHTGNMGCVVVDLQETKKCDRPQFARYEMEFFLSSLICGIW